MIAAITEVWQEILTWFTTALGSIQTVFVTTSGSGADVTYTLTFMGVLAVISVAIGIVFLLVGVIQNFLHLRS